MEQTRKINENNKRLLEAIEMDDSKKLLEISPRKRIRNEAIRRRIAIEGSLHNDMEASKAIGVI